MLNTYSLTELKQSSVGVDYSTHDTVSQNYVVMPGDSLWEISRKFRTTVRSICNMNGINENTVLKVGMKLKIN